MICALTSTSFATEDMYEIGDNQKCITIDFLINATRNLSIDEDGNIVITLIREQTKNKSHDSMEFEHSRLDLYADSIEDANDILEQLDALRENINLRDNPDYFYGASLSVYSSISHIEKTYNGILHGKPTSIYILCSVNSGTILDNIDLYLGECGITPSGNNVSYDTTFTSVSNNATHYYPSSWPYVRWDNSGEAGAEVTVTVHRGTNTPKTFHHYNNLLP